MLKDRGPPAAGRRRRATRRPESETPCRRRRRRGRFLALFRTTPPRTVCPNFYVLAHANGCLFSPPCSYCFLKSSLWFLRRPQAFSNTGALLAEVRRWLARDELESFVLNAGNLSDSLVFERRRPLLRPLIELFRRAARGRPHTLLLVTKGGRRECAGLLRLAPCPNVVVSFSVNSAAAARRHEAGAPPPAERLAAAARLKARGWRVRVRLDPLLAGYDYAATLRAVRRLGGERITLGCLRAEEGLARFVEPGLFRKLEAPPEGRGLWRYPLAQRLALYRPAVAALRGTGEIALCEETPEVWDALGLDRRGCRCNCGR